MDDEGIEEIGVTLSMLEGLSTEGVYRGASRDIILLGYPSRRGGRLVGGSPRGGTRTRGGMKGSVVIHDIAKQRKRDEQLDDRGKERRAIQYLRSALSLEAGLAA